MKKLLFPFLMLAVFSTHGQDYKLVNGNSKKLFQTLSEPSSAYSLSIESGKVNGYDSIYFNFFGLAPEWIISDSCEFWGGPACTQQNYPVWTGPKIVFDNNHNWQFYNQKNDTLNFSFDKDLDGPIPFYRDSIQEFSMLFESEDTLTILGNLDSVLVFRISHYDLNGNSIDSELNGKPISISKEFGLTDFFVVDSFPSVLKPIKILGNISPDAGFFQLTNEMVFNYEVGDELQYQEYSHYYDFQPPWLYYDRFRKWIILERHQTNDSLNYKVRQELFYVDSIGLGIDTITVRYPRFDVIAQIPFEKFDWRSRSLVQEKFCGQLKWAYSTDSYNDASFCVEDICWGGRDVPGPPEHRITLMACGLGMVTDDRYVEGPSGYHAYEKLIFSKKNDISCGNEAIVGYGEIHKLKVEIVLKPNPAHGTVHISSLTEIKQVKLFDLTGNIQLEKAFSAKETTIEIGHLSGGLYFAQFILENGQITTNKLMVIKR